MRVVSGFADWGTKERFYEGVGFWDGEGEEEGAGGEVGAPLGGDAEIGGEVEEVADTAAELEAQGAEGDALFRGRLRHSP